MVALLPVGIGCAPATVDEATAQSAQAAYDQALVDFQEGRYEQAKSGFDLALGGSGLPVDFQADALFKRSMCLAATGDFEAAQADIDEASAGAMDEAQIHVARGFLLAQQGDQAAAQAEFRQAKQLNPQVEIPEL